MIFRNLRLTEFSWLDCTLYVRLNEFTHTDDVRIESKEARDGTKKAKRE